MASTPPVSAARVTVDLGARSYDIVIGRGVIGDPRSWSGLRLSGDAMVVTNEVVAGLHLESLISQLRSRHPRVHVVRLPDGEQHKQWSTLNTIFDALLGSGCDRRVILYALGGGVVGDITGFAAACYMRGVAYVQVPTTLLAQVDSSVGGKTAINHPMGKNMIGAFHQPLRVLCDIDHLATLPEREFRSGLAEVVKYGPVADEAFFEWIERHVDELVARDAGALMHAIQRSCEIKAGIVGRDERDAELRAILNFGHTFGHAIEAGVGYGAWLHGEAVACGMLMATDLSAELGLIDPSLAARMRSLVRRCGLPCQGPAIGPERLIDLMQVDKKASGGEIQFVLLRGAGQAVVRPAPQMLVRRVIERNSAPVQAS